MNRDDWIAINKRFAALGARWGIKFEVIDVGRESMYYTDSDSTSEAIGKCLRNFLLLAEFDPTRLDTTDFDSVPKEIARRSDIPKFTKE